MKNVFLPVVALALLASWSVSAQASDKESCASIQWKDPHIAKSCSAVVERNGKKYVKMAGKVTKKGKMSLTVMLDQSKEELTWMPDLGDVVTIDGKEVSPMSVSVGQSLRFYVPEAMVTNQAP
jgi:hypothetical protein